MSSGKNHRRDSIDDFKEESFRPLGKVAAKSTSSLSRGPPKPAADASTSNNSTLNKEGAPRNCAICNTSLTEARYSEHFTSCMKQRSAKLAAANKTAAALAKGTIRPITDFIPVKPSTSVKSLHEPEKAAPTTSTTTTDLPDASTIVLPFCPVCGRVIKTDKSYAPHLKQCAKRYNVAPDLLLELSKKQMSVPVESPATSKSSSLTNKASSTKKRPVRFVELPYSMEDEQLQLAVALSASVIETHVSHLPVAPVLNEINETRPVKRPKRQNSFEHSTSSSLRDPAEGQMKLLELINSRFVNSNFDEGYHIHGVTVQSSLGCTSYLYQLTCSSPSKLSETIKVSNSLLEMPPEFHIDTCDFEMPISIDDNGSCEVVCKNVVLLTANSPSKEALTSPSDMQIRAEDGTHVVEDTIHFTESADNYYPRSPSFSSCQANEETTLHLPELRATCTRSSAVQLPSLTDQATQTEEATENNVQCVSSDLLRLLKLESTCDIQFSSANGSLIGAHCLILFARCRGLVEKWSPHTTNKQSLSLSLNVSDRLSGYTSEFISQFLEYIYTGVLPQNEFSFEIKILFDSLQRDPSDNQEEQEESGAFRTVSPQKNDGVEAINDSLLVAVANGASPSYDDEFGNTVEQDVTMQPFYEPVTEPIELSSDSQDVRLSYCDSKKNDIVNSVDPEPLLKNCEMSAGDVIEICSDAGNVDYHTTSTPETPVTIANAEEADAELPSIGDEWLEFDDPGHYDDICHYQELPLSQAPVSEKENELIAEFGDMLQPSEEDDNGPMSFASDVVNIPLSSDVQTEISVPSKQVLASNNVAKRINLSKRKTPVTPAIAAIQQRVRSLTTPPYSQMATPNLAKLLSKYGVRRLPKKHMVLKLKEIHSVLKPKQTAEGTMAADVKNDARPGCKQSKSAVSSSKGGPLKQNLHWKDRRRYQMSASSSSSSENEEVSDDDNNDCEEDGEVTLEPNALSLLDDSEDGEEDADEGIATFFTQSQSISASQAVSMTESQQGAKKSKSKKIPKIVLTGEEFNEKVAAFIRNDKELYSDLLQFKPLPFKEIYSRVRKIGNFACSKQQLVDFLDQQCITFRLTPGKSHRPPPPPPPEKKPKTSRSDKNK